MEIKYGQKYRVMELPKAIVILPHDAVAKDGRPLVEADTSHLFRYLSRYFAEREAGRQVEDAHAAALRIATSGIILS